MTSNDVMLDSGLLEGSRKTQKLSTFPKRITALVAGGCGLFLATSGAMTFTRPWMRKAVSSSPIVLPSVDSCHPLDGQTFKIWVSGYDNVDLNKWLSFNNDGNWQDNWLIADYDSKGSAMPVHFEGAYFTTERCDTYTLQNKYENGNFNWIGLFGFCLRAFTTSDEAAAFQFTDNGDGTYSMQNVWWNADFNSNYVSFTGSETNFCGHELRSLRADYGKGSAMKMTLHDAGNSSSLA